MDHIFKTTDQMKEEIRLDIERAFSFPHVWGFHSKPLNLKKLQDIVTATEVIRPGKIWQSDFQSSKANSWI